MIQKINGELSDRSNQFPHDSTQERPCSESVGMERFVLKEWWKEGYCLYLSDKIIMWWTDEKQFDSQLVPESWITI